jgi:hypothetical protein
MQMSWRRRVCCSLCSCGKLTAYTGLPFVWLA